MMKLRKNILRASTIGVLLTTGTSQVPVQADEINNGWLPAPKDFWVCKVSRTYRVNSSGGVSYAPVTECKVKS